MAATIRQRAGTFLARTVASAFGVAVNPVHEGASQSPRVARWRPSSAGPNGAMNASLSTLRVRSRDRVRNDGMADGALDVLATNIVGTGIKPQFATKNAAFNKKLAKLWLEWTDSADADGRFDFYGLQASAVRSMLDGGDAFTRMIPLPLGSADVPLQLRVFESEVCPLEKTEAYSGGGYTHQGVQFSATGDRSGYWMHPHHPNDGLMRAAFASNEARLVPAEEIAHLAWTSRPGQIRGEPKLGKALLTLVDLDEYDDAQLVRQKIAALFAGFVRGTAEAPFFGEEGAPDDGGVSLASLDPGTMQVLPDGAEVDFATPPGPGESFEAVGRHYQRKIARAASVLYEQLSGDYSQINDRTYRAAINEFRRKVRMIQHHLLVFQMCRPVLRRWLELGMLAGTIKLPRGVSFAEAATPNWVPEGFAYIHPVQDVQSRILERRAGFRSRAEIVSETGRDIDDVDAEIAAEDARADEKKMVLDSDPRRTSYGGASQAKPAGSGFPDPGTAPGPADEGPST